MEEEQVEERKPQKRSPWITTDSGRWGLHLGRALGAEQWPQPTDHGAGTQSRVFSLWLVSLP